MRKKNQKGFSLIELLIVVAIIGIIAAIAIPSLIRARAAANEASAIGTLRTIGSAQATRMSRNGNVPGDLAALSTEKYIDEALNADGVTRNSYKFSTGAGANAAAREWYFTAVPDGIVSGERGFGISEDFVVRFESGIAAPAHLAGSVLGK